MDREAAGSAVEMSFFANSAYSGLHLMMRRFSLATMLHRTAIASA
jgi:hypothetical protein